MDKFLSQSFQKLADTALPAGLHTATIRAVTLRYYRKYIIMLTSIIIVTFLFSLWDVYLKIVEMDVVTVVKTVYNTFELSLDSVTDSIETLFQFLPIQAIVFFTLNLSAVIFMIFILKSFARMEGKSEIT